MSSVLFCGQSLTAVADGAAEARGNVRTEAGMIAEWLWCVFHGWIINTKMTRSAAVHTLEPGKKYLVDLRRRCENSGLGHSVGLALCFELQKLFLVSLPRWRICLPRRSQNERKRK